MVCVRSDLKLTSYIVNRLREYIFPLKTRIHSEFLSVSTHLICKGEDTLLSGVIYCKQIHVIGEDILNIEGSGYYNDDIEAYPITSPLV